MVRDEEHAQLLQMYAVQALDEVKAWVWSQHATLLPGRGPFTREQAEAYAAHIEWFSRLEAALETLSPAENHQPG